MTEEQKRNAERLVGSVAALIQSECPHEGSPRVGLVSLPQVVRRPRRVWKWALVLPLPAMAAAAALLYIQGRPLTIAVTGARLSAARELVAEGSRAPALRFSDGTEVAFSPRSDAQVAAITAHGASVVLRHGRASANVVHRARARWYFMAGPYQIDVVGTRFSVDWQPGVQRLLLEMQHGKVRVTGPLVPQGTYLTQGQRLLVNVQQADLRITNVSDVVSARPAPRSPAVDSESPVAPRASVPVRRMSDRAVKTAKVENVASAGIAQLVAQGAYAAAIKQIEGDRLNVFLAQAASAELSALAEAARYEQNVNVARASLLAQRKRFPRTRAGAEAAFHLGRLAEDVDNTPARAASWFELYLQDQPTGRFASEGLGRQMVATSRMGDRAGARKLAEAYMQRFAQGTYARVAQQLAGTNP